jgi:tripartite-type tricarboxylate transporter receptor subunit TctC
MLAGACAQQAPEDAGDYPRRSIKLIVPFPAGSTTDITARVVAQCFERDLQQPVVVENRPGGDGIVGASEAARATPDGYSLVQLSTSSAVIAPHFTPGAGYTVDSFDLIGSFVSVPSIVVVHGSSPITSMQQLLAQPQPVTMTSTGPQASGGLVIEGLVRNHGLRANQIPMGSIGEARRGLTEGDYGAAVLPLSKDVLPWATTDFRTLAITSEQRMAYLPDVPTLRELGLGSGQPIDTILGFWAGPKDMPQGIVDRLDEVMRGCAADPQVRENLGPFTPDTYIDAEQTQVLLREAESNLKAEGW